MGSAGSEMKRGNVILEQGSGLEYNEMRQCLFELHCATTKLDQFKNIIASLI